MTTQDGQPFQLQVLWEEEDWAFKTIIVWKRQCWGCGGPGVREDLKLDCGESFYMTAFEDEIDQSTHGILKAEFCSQDCIARAIPQLAQAISGWREDREGGRSNGSCIHFRKLTTVLTVCRVK